MLLFPPLLTASMAPLFITTCSFALLLLLCFQYGIQLGHGGHLQNDTSACSAHSKLYIIYMRRVATGDTRLAHNHTASHLRLLQSALGSAQRARKSLIYSYKHAINGFSALLSQHHVRTLEGMEGVLQIVPSETRTQPLTTNSWNFLGLSEQHSINIASKNSTIIGLIDSGVNPELPSFSENRLGPIPARWKGTCDGGPGFPPSYCNRKLIGARYYVDGWRSYYKRDPDERIDAFDRVLGHGTPVASIAGGEVVDWQDELVSGQVRGGNPLARLAMYKVIWDRVANDADVLKAMDDAIDDGVDIINLSIGKAVHVPYYRDPLAISSFHAMRKNIFTVHSAGNFGPADSSIIAAIPWTITVAATTTNRDILSPIRLLDIPGLLPGFSTFLNDMPLSWYNLVSGERIKAPYASIDDARHCRQGSLDPTQASGKIIFCKQALSENIIVLFEKINYFRVIQAAGMILEDDTRLSDPPDVSPYFPFSIVSSIVGLYISNYIQSPRTSPMARILRSEAYFNWRGAPAIAGFSSRGPNNVTRNMLKPDVAAPGVGIVAGDGRGEGQLYSHFSGTSMATPHVSGVASLLRAYHGFAAPWSPAALKSALMTTASVLNDRDQPIMIDAGTREANPLDYGSGQMQPLRALDEPGPGLIYDADVNDYVRLMCHLGYNDTLITDLFLDPSTDERANCTGQHNPAMISQINFPSIAIAELRGRASIIRTLTNVAPLPSTHYRPSIEAPLGVLVTVTPSLLEFSAAVAKITYTLQLQAHPSSSLLPATQPRFGSITWSDELGHRVYAPIVVHSVYNAANMENI